MTDVKREWLARRVGFKQAVTISFQETLDPATVDEYHTPPLAPASLLMAPDTANGVEPAIGFVCVFTYHSTLLVRSQLRWCSDSTFTWNSAWPLGNSTGTRSYMQMTGSRQMIYLPTLYAFEFTTMNLSGLMNPIEGVITLFAVVR